MQPAQRRQLQYLRSLDAQVHGIQHIRDHLHRSQKLCDTQYRVLLFMLAHLEGQISCLVRTDESVED